jgi:hypothetical protein
MGPRVRGSSRYVYLLLAGASANPVLADPVSFRIEAQEATEALTQFALQAHQQLLFEAAKLKGHRTNALAGRFEPMDALTLMLKGTGLKAVVWEGHVVVIEPERNSLGGTSPAVDVRKR